MSDRVLYVSTSDLDAAGDDWAEIASHAFEHYWQAEDAYEELISDCYPDVTIGYATFSAGEIMRKLSPIDFRIGCSDEYVELNESDYPQVFAAFYSV